MTATAVSSKKPQTTSEASPLSQDESDAVPYLWTCNEYHRMMEEGYFADKRVELLDGEILQMPAQLTFHAVAVGLIRRVMDAAYGAGYDVRIQAPATLNPHSEPEPDILVARGDPKDYITHHPGPGEIVLLIEVSDRTLNKDRRRETRAYARAGIADYWIVNLVNRCLEIYRDPLPDGRYQDAQTYSPGEVVNPLTLPDAEIRVADLLPPLS